MDWGALGGILQAVFGATTIVSGGIAAMMFVSVRTLRESIEDRDKRIAGLEGRVSDLELQITKELASHEMTRRDLDALARVVTGEAHWVAIEQKIDDLPRQLASAIREGA